MDFLNKSRGWQLQPAACLVFLLELSCLESVTSPSPHIAKPGGRDVSLEFMRVFLIKPRGVVKHAPLWLSLSLSTEYTAEEPDVAQHSLQTPSPPGRSEILPSGVTSLSPPLSALAQSPGPKFRALEGHGNRKHPAAPQNVSLPGSVLRPIGSRGVGPHTLSIPRRAPRPRLQWLHFLVLRKDPGKHYPDRLARKPHKTTQFEEELLLEKPPFWVPCEFVCAGVIPCCALTFLVKTAPKASKLELLSGAFFAFSAFSSFSAFFLAIHSSCCPWRAGKKTETWARIPFLPLTWHLREGT